MPQVQKITEKRKKSIDKFLKEFTVEDFKNICSLANNNSFLTGENDRHWKADFDFIMRTDKATAILEGKYNNNFNESNFNNNIQRLMKEAEIEDEQKRNNSNSNNFSF